MIKFFRKIRQRLVTENKISKYLLYAIGEIVLVVIGILIALMLNTQKELNTNKTQIEGVLKTISKNLENDIIAINEVLEIIEMGDSLANRILEKKLTASDYQGPLYNNKVIEFTRGNIEVIQYETNAYNRLMESIEIIPEEYNPIIELLQDVYSLEMPISHGVEVEIKNYKIQIEDHLRKTFDWYSGTDSIHKQQELEYYLNDPMYFNNVLMLQRHINHLSVHMRSLKAAITIAYNKIHKELTPNAPFSEHMLVFEFDEYDELVEYFGKYKNEKMNPNIPDTITFESKDSLLNLLPLQVQLVKKEPDEFLFLADEDFQLNFIRNDDGSINSAKFTKRVNKDSVIVEVFNKIK